MSDTTQTGGSILHIDDDHQLAGLLRKEFEELGYAFTHAADGADGLAQAKSGGFSIVILDVNLPSMNGFDVLRELRTTDTYVPVVMLTSKAEDADKVVGLELGADDYVTKPFALPELRARVRAVLRRVAQITEKALPDASSRQIRVGELFIDLDTRAVELAGQPCALTPLEFDMLAFLAASPGRVFTREQILENVWQVAIADYNSSINSLVRRLRMKIEPDQLNPRYILTARGVGFRFARDEELRDMQ